MLQYGWFVLLRKGINVVQLILTILIGIVVTH